MAAASGAIAAGDPDVFGGKTFWAQLLRLDLAIDDLSHFIDWSRQLDELARHQAEDVIQECRALHHDY